MAESRDSNQTLIQRRKFLQTGTLAGAAAIVAPAGVASAQSETAGSDAAPPGTTPLMTAQAEAAPPADVQVIGANERSGSDFMLDVIKSLDFDYICANPGLELPGTA